ncbi:MAG: metallophosphoesterase family protein [Candidatus Micrarchaeota archaeon]|nr:metallophosphoesterase family protein [Candidatus Micrarchaeota archaeon]
MKIGIVSDTHFGYKRFYDDAFEQGKHAFIKAAELCDVILSPGDVFDSRIPSLDTLIKTIDIFNQVKRLNKRIYVIPGTHERRSKELSNPIEILEKADLVINVHNKTEIFEKENEKISVSGLGGVPEEFAKEALKHLTIKTYKDCFNIFMFHQTIQEFMPVPMPEMMSLEDLPKGFDLYVCGHYHKNRTIIDKERNFRFVIPGSTVLTQLKEEEQGPKGFYIYDTKKDEFEFVTIPSRNFFVIKLNFDKVTNTQINKALHDKLEEYLDSENFTKAHEKTIVNEKQKPIIKVILSGTYKKNENILLEINNFSDRALIEVQNNLVEEGNTSNMNKYLQEMKNYSTNIIKEIIKDSFKGQIELEQLSRDIDLTNVIDVFADDDQQEHQRIIDAILNNIVKDEEKTNNQDN